jgi:hypothetical protein
LAKLKLDDKKPSQFLQEMRSLAPQGISEDVLHSLWIQRMPVNVRCVFTEREDVELTNLVEIANRMLDKSSHSKVMSSDNPRSEPPTSSQGHAVDFSEERFTNVEKQLSALATTVKNIQTLLKTSANTNERT